MQAGACPRARRASLRAGTCSRCKCRCRRARRDCYRQQGGTAPVRFGSAEFAAEVLPAAQGAALAKAAAAVGREKRLSVLVRGAPGRPADEYGEDAVVRLFTFQARPTIVGCHLCSQPQSLNFIHGDIRHAPLIFVGLCPSVVAGAAYMSDCVQLWLKLDPSKPVCISTQRLLLLHDALQDTLNERSTAAVAALLDGRWEGSRQGRDAKHVVMLTGDNPASAERIARLVGIRDVRAVRTSSIRSGIPQQSWQVLCAVVCVWHTAAIRTQRCVS